LSQPGDDISDNLQMSAGMLYTFNVNCIVRAPVGGIFPTCLEGKAQIPLTFRQRNLPHGQLFVEPPIRCASSRRPATPDWHGQSLPVALAGKCADPVESAVCVEYLGSHAGQ